MRDKIITGIILIVSAFCVVLLISIMPFSYNQQNTNIASVVNEYDYPTECIDGILHYKFTENVGSNKTAGFMSPVFTTRDDSSPILIKC